MLFNSNFALSGRTIIITRAKNQQTETRKCFEAAGAKVLDLPALEIGPPDDFSALDKALRNIDNFNWLIFSSINGVNAIKERLDIQHISLSSIPNTLKIAAVGKKTAGYLEKLGVKVDFVPPNFVADSLIENFPIACSGLKILIPRVQSGGRTILTQAFSKLGAEVVEVPAYESRCPIDFPEITANALAKKEVDIIAFTSGKTVQYTSELMKGYFKNKLNYILEDVKIVSIGPQTSISCKRFFSRVDQEASPHDLDGLILACIKSVSI